MKYKQALLTYKGIEVIKTPWYLRWSPWYRFFRASAMYSKIILREDIFNNLFSKNPDPSNVAMMEHEITHIKRQEKIGIWKFQTKYNLFPKFRLQEELEADKARIKYLKEHNLPNEFDARAKQLSSWGYYWMIKEKDAKKALEKIWKES